MKLALVYGEAPKQIYVCLSEEAMRALLVKEAKFSMADATSAIAALRTALDLAARRK